MSIKILKRESGGRVIEINGEKAGALTPPENYQVIHSISTMGTIHFIMIPDTVALSMAAKINDNFTATSANAEDL